MRVKNSTNHTPKRGKRPRIKVKKPRRITSAGRSHGPGHGVTDLDGGTPHISSSVK